MIDAISLAGKIVEVADQLHGSVSHGTLISNLGEEVCCGDYVMITKKNIVVVSGASKTLLDAIHLLRCEDPPRVKLRLADSGIIAMLDGCPIPVEIPFANRIPEKGYKKPRYWPLIIDAL